MEGGSVSFSCDAIGICNTFTVLWFRHSTEGGIRMNSSGHISQSDWHSDKYRILTSDPQAAANGRCIIGSALTINRFNHSDDGYYWCQIVSNNSCLFMLAEKDTILLQPSTRGYIAVGEIMNEHSCTYEYQLLTPICAEEATSRISEDIGCSSDSLKNIMPTVTIGSHSTYVYSINSLTYIYNINSTTATSTVTLLDTTFDREQNIMLWVYGMTAVFLLVIIVLALTLIIIVSIKCRTHQKQSEYNTLYNINDFLLIMVFYAQHQYLVFTVTNYKKYQTLTTSQLPMLKTMWVPIRKKYLIQQ